MLTRWWCQFRSLFQNGGVEVKPMTLEWMPAGSIEFLPQWHSNGMNIKRVMIVLSDLSEPQIGYYFGPPINQWRLCGSPSRQSPTHWMPLPPMPEGPQ